MKRFTAFVLLLSLVSSYVGAEICVDYCCDQIEAIHFGESSKGCHLDDCHEQEKKSDCCSSDQLTLQPHFQDFTTAQEVSRNIVLKLVPFGFTSVTPEITDNHVIASKYSTEDHPKLLQIPILDKTQVIRC